MWTSSVDYSQDVSIGDEILQRTSDTYRKFATPSASCWAALSDLSNVWPDCVAWDELEPIDQYMMAKTASMLDGLPRPTTSTVSTAFTVQRTIS